MKGQFAGAHPQPCRQDAVQRRCDCCPSPPLPFLPPSCRHAHHYSSRRARYIAHVLIRRRRYQNEEGGHDGRADAEDGADQHDAAVRERGPARDAARNECATPRPTVNMGTARFHTRTQQLFPNVCVCESCFKCAAHAPLSASPIDRCYPLSLVLQRARPNSRRNFEGPGRLEGLG